MSGFHLSLHFLDQSLRSYRKFHFDLGHFYWSKNWWCYWWGKFFTRPSSPNMRLMICLQWSIWKLIFKQRNDLWVIFCYEIILHNINSLLTDKHFHSLRKLTQKFTRIFITKNVITLITKENIKELRVG